MVYTFCWVFFFFFCIVALSLPQASGEEDLVYLSQAPGEDLVSLPQAPFLELFEHMVQ